MINNSMYEPDELDLKIVEIIRDNARMSYSEIAERVNVSRVSVKNRMDNLEQRGIIKGYRTVIDEKGAPEGSMFFLDIEISQERMEEALEFLSRDKAIREIYLVTGVCMVRAIGYTSNQHNVKLVADRLYRGGVGIKRIIFSTVLSTIKNIDGGVDYVRYKEPEHLEEGQPMGKSKQGNEGCQSE